jgi:competence protein ComEC
VVLSKRHAFERRSVRGSGLGGASIATAPSSTIVIAPDSAKVEPAARADAFEFGLELIAPLYAVAIAIVSGDATGNIGLHVGALPAIIAGAVAGFAMLAGRRHAGLLIAYASIFLAAAYASSALLNPIHDNRSIRRYPDTALASIRGVVLKPIERVAGKVRAVVRVSDAATAAFAMTPASGVVRVITPPEFHAYAGDTIEAFGRIRLPRNFGNPGEFDYEAYMARSGIDASLSGNSRAGARRGDSGVRIIARTAPLYSVLLARVRDRIERTIYTSLAGDARAIMIAITLGDRSLIGDDLRNRFARAGLAHLLVISGLHLGIVAAAVFAAARLAVILMFPIAAGRGWANKGAAIVASCAAMAYAVLAEPHISTMRALVMVLAYMLALLTDRWREPLSSLALAAIVICALMPGSTADIGFQLSIASVAAIILGMRRFAAWIERRKRRDRLPREPSSIWWIAAEAPLGYLGVSFWAMVATAPLTAYYFNQLSIGGVAANAVIVPIIGMFATVTGLCAAALSIVSPAGASIVFRIAGAAISIGDRLAGWFDSIPYSWMRIFTPSPFELVLTLSLILLWLSAPLAEHIPSDQNENDAPKKYPRWRMLAAATIVIALAIDAGLWLRDRYFNPDLRLTFLSVGEGDGAIVRFPRGPVMVVDCGPAFGSFDVGAEVIGRYLRANKIMKVDYIVVSHPDLDHYGGCEDIAEEFHPTLVWTSDAGSPNPSYESMLGTIARLGIPERRGGIPPLNEIGRVRIESENLFRRPAGAAHNNSSLVFKLVFGHVGALFTGDIEAPAERAMLAQSSDLRASIIKVPHHGSASSSTPEFVTAVDARYAVISDGFENRYRFPASDVIQRYRAAGATVLRTDKDGAVMIEIQRDGKISVSSYRSPGSQARSPDNSMP